MSGYIGNIPIPQATQTRDTFTATAGQTSFATSGYTPSFLDVFMNGVHLVNGTDYTATNGSDVVLTSGAADGDVLEVVAYSTYQVNSQNYTGGLTVDNDGATVLTVDRASSDGTIIDLQRNGSTVGSIYNGGGNLGVNSSGGLLLIDDIITPTSGADATHDIGRSSARYKDLYLSGGVYLGGTGAANYLDDYEEGSWTPDLGSSVPSSEEQGFYTKIGDTVFIEATITVGSTSDTNHMQITNFPFAANNLTRGGFFIRYSNYGTNGFFIHMNGNASSCGLYAQNGGVLTYVNFSGARLDFVGHYRT